MAETKDEITAERDALRTALDATIAERDDLQATLSDAEREHAQENARLRAQLAAAGQPAGVQVPQHRFMLSEGDRQELEIRGVVNIGGRLWTREEVQTAMSAAGPDKQGNNDQSGVEIKEAPEGTRLDPDEARKVTGPGIRGVDFVYPSVERGKIDPAVAGTPGISGPAA